MKLHSLTVDHQTVPGKCMACTLDHWPSSPYETTEARSIRLLRTPVERESSLTVEKLSNGAAGPGIEVVLIIDASVVDER
jgi:dihydroxyacid dehydratase/phosphogluconate dehydratase